MLRILRYIIEAIAAFVGVSIVLGLILTWRLSSNVITSDFLTPYFEAGIESIVPGSKAHFGSTLVSWTRVDTNISVHADNITVDDEAGAEIANVKSFDAKISVLGLVLGQFMPKELSIVQPQIKLNRTAQGVFVFGGVAMGDNNSSPSHEQPEAITIVFHNILQHLSHAALMRKLAVTEATFDIHDEGTQKDWSAAVPEISVVRTGLGSFAHLEDHASLTGRMTIEITQKDTLASLDVKYTYDPSSEEFGLSSVFHDVTPAFIAGGHPESIGLDAAAIADLPLTGQVKLKLDKDFSLIEFVAQIHGDQGQLVYPYFWDKPRFIKSFDLNADYNRSEKKLSLSDTHIDFGGPELFVNVKGTPSTQQNKDIDFVAELKVTNLPMNDYDDTWPKPILPDARYWMVPNLRNGTYTRAEALLKGNLALNDLSNFSVTEGGGKISLANGRVTYMDEMPPVEGVNADATFDLKKMDIQITSGGTGNVRVTPFTLEISGLSDPDQAIDIPMAVSSPIEDMMALLDHKPLEYAKALGLSPGELNGRIDGIVDFQFPLLRTIQTKDVAVHAKAKTTGLNSSKLIPSIPVDQGNLNLTLDTSGFTLEGQAALSKIPFQISWRENFGAHDNQPLRKITANGIIRDNQWNNFGISFFDGSKGPMGVNLSVTEPDKNKTIYVGSLDMTNASIDMEMLDWKKPSNTSAVLQFTATAVPGKPIFVAPFALKGTQLQANGDAMISPDMSHIIGLNVSPLILGRTNANLHFIESSGEDGNLRFDAQGSSLDVTGLRGGNDPDRTDPRPKEYHINVGKLYTGPTNYIADAKGFASRDQKGWLEINFEGRADGDTPLSIELLPQEDGHSTFAIECSSFGKAMNGLGFTDAISGGKLSIHGESTVDTPRVINGSAEIGDFSIKGLPVLALLLSATSPFGIGDILTDSASFSRFEGDFRWEGDAFTLNNAHAAGSAVGINVNGRVDMNSGDANLQGTLVPFSMVNNVLNAIPIIGDLITGGHNQGVFAVAYTIKGPLKTPKILVNPTSLLTPGFIRNLFFRDNTSQPNVSEKPQ